jgi:hypothetical protein
LTKPFLHANFAQDFYSDTLQAGLRTLKIESKSTYLRMKTLSGMNRNSEGRRPDDLQNSAFPFNDMNGLSSCTPLPPAAPSYIGIKLISLSSSTAATSLPHFRQN